MRKGPGRPKHLRKNCGRRNPAGSKMARKCAKYNGAAWRGEIFHGGALTAAADKRAGRRTGWALVRA